MKLLLSSKTFERTARSNNQLTAEEVRALVFAIKKFLNQSNEEKPPIMLNLDFRRLAAKVEALHLDGQALEISLLERTLTVSRAFQTLRIGLNALA